MADRITAFLSRAWPFARPNSSPASSDDYAALMAAILAGKAPQRWTDAVVNSLDGGTVSFSVTCKAARSLTISAAECATITVQPSTRSKKAPGWSRALAKAHAELKRRPVKHSTTLALQDFAPSPDVLTELSKIPPGARYAITELQVQTAPKVTLSTTQVQALTSAYSNVHSLHLTQVGGVLPDLKDLPRLRSLSLTQSCTGADLDSASNRVAQIGPQLTSLVFSTTSGEPDWSKVFTQACPDLARFATHHTLTEELLRAPQTHAPNVEHLAVCGVFLRPAASQAAAEWRVAQLRMPFYAPDKLCMLPRPAAGSVVLGGSEAGMPPVIEFTINGPEGFADAVREALPLWRFTQPTAATFRIPNDTTENVHTGINAALTSLGPILPAGSVIDILAKGEAQAAAAEAGARGAAASAALAHVTVRLPWWDGGDARVGELLAQTPRLPHARFDSLSLQGTHRDVAWPWRSVGLTGRFRFTELLMLPDPSGGQYEVWLDNEIVHQRLPFQMLPDRLSELQRRLSHLTFVIEGDQDLAIHAPYGLQPYEQPAILADQLRSIRGLRWRAGLRGGRLGLRLVGWTLTRDLLHTLRDHLPTFTLPTRLMFVNCTWVKDRGLYKQLAACVPECYDEWYVTGCAPEHVLDVCAGAAGRARAGGRAACDAALTVIVSSGVGCDEKGRAKVEAGVQKKGLWRWTEVRWDGQPQ